MYETVIFPSLQFLGVIMVLGAAFEFESGHNQEIVSRRSDNEEIPMVCISDLVL